MRHLPEVHVENRGARRPEEEARFASYEPFSRAHPKQRAAALRPKFQVGGRDLEDLGDAFPPVPPFSGTYSILGPGCLSVNQSPSVRPRRGKNKTQWVRLL